MSCPKSLTRMLLLSSAVLVLLASSASAQSLITTYQVRIYLEGGAQPVSTFDIASTDVRCGQPLTPTPGLVYNPTHLRWADELNPSAMECVWTDSGTGPLFAMPVSMTNTYRAKLVAIDPIGSSPESVASNPFQRRGLPAAPTNVRMTRP